MLPIVSTNSQQRPSSPTEMFEYITEYIKSGNYPEWPYRGADLVEKIYQEKGTPGVRQLMNSLREDPSFAQDKFDSLFEVNFEK